METITFYSYKGGVGRSLAVTNVAYYLSRFGFNVCVLDFDLEAPGLHHKFSSTSNDFRQKAGLVDYIYNFFYENISLDIKDLQIEIPLEKKEHGELSLIQAGNTYSNEYLSRLSTINWDDIFYNENSSGLLFFDNLKKEIEEVIQPDFLIIDSRTGITEIGGLCTSVLADRVVFISVNNEESLHGCKLIYENTLAVRRKLERLPLKFHFVLSRIPYDEDLVKEEELKSKFKKFMNIDFAPFVIHSNRALEFSEDIIMRSFVDHDESIMAQDYLNLFSNLIDTEKLKPKLESLIEEVFSGLIVLENPDVAQKELEALAKSYPHTITYERLIDLYKIRNVDNNKIVEVFHKSWAKSKTFSEKNLEFYIKLFLNEDINSWNSVEFNGEIIEYFFEKYEISNFQLYSKLGQLFFKNGLYSKAEFIFTKLMGVKEFEVESLGYMISIYANMDSTARILELLEQFKKQIFGNDKILINLITYLVKIDALDYLYPYLDFVTNEFKMKLWNSDVLIAFEYFSYFNEDDEYLLLLERDLNKAVARNHEKKILELGRVYFKIGSRDYFKDMINDIPNKHKILERLDFEGHTAM